MSDFDLFLADCPARTTLEIIGHTWSVVVVVALGERELRYGELLERIGGISKKMLTQTLRRLRGHGLVVHADGRYELTKPRALAACSGTRTRRMGRDTHQRAARSPGRVREPIGSLAGQTLRP